MSGDTEEENKNMANHDDRSSLWGTRLDVAVLFLVWWLEFRVAEVRGNSGQGKFLNTPPEGVASAWQQAASGLHFTA